MHVVSADILIPVHGGPTWECAWWPQGTMEQLPDRSAVSFSIRSTTSSPRTMTSPSSSSVLPFSSATWCSPCASPPPHTPSPPGPAAMSQAGVFSWRTVRSNETEEPDYKTLYCNTAFFTHFESNRDVGEIKTCIKPTLQYVSVSLCFITGELASRLQEASVKIINRNTCNKLYDDAVTPRMLCAGNLQGGVDACQVCV